MKKNINSAYLNLASGFLLVATVISQGTVHSQNIQDPTTGKAKLNTNTGIPDKASKAIGIPAKTFYAVVVDTGNTKWFLTESGIISLSGENWKLHNENSMLAHGGVKDLAFEMNPDGPHLWIASANGITIARLPIGINPGATASLTDTTGILSNNVIKVAIGRNSIHWFGTDKGVSAYVNNKWLSPSYELFYPERMFKLYPISSMAVNRNGDSLYVGTEGAGVARVFRNNVDGISGASVYAIWGPINLPSDNIYSIFIASDGTKWFGTDKGVARHTGNKTLENWTVFTTGDGLVNNFVQAIAADRKGNLWFGTRGGGISVFNGSAWTSYTTADGLNSNNILCIAVDRNGLVWIGTDDGVCCYNKGGFISYR